MKKQALLVAGITAAGLLVLAGCGTGTRQTIVQVVEHADHRHDHGHGRSGRLGRRHPHLCE